MSKGVAARHTFGRLELEIPHELPQREQLENAPKLAWRCRDEAIRIAARIRAQLSRTDQVLLVAGITRSDHACELAWESALALSHLDQERVLLVDADVSSPSLHKRLGASVSPGIGGAVAGDCSLTDAIRTVIPDLLYFIPAGSAKHGTAALFASPDLAPLIQAMRAEYHFVVFSAPPVLPEVSASLLSSLADGVILAVSAGSQRRAELLAAQDEFRSLKAKMLGVVLCDNEMSNRSTAKK